MGRALGKKGQPTIVTSMAVTLIFPVCLEQCCRGHLMPPPSISAILIFTYEVTVAAQKSSVPLNNPNTTPDPLQGNLFPQVQERSSTGYFDM